MLKSKKAALTEAAEAAKAATGGKHAEASKLRGEQAALEKEVNELTAALAETRSES